MKLAEFSTARPESITGGCENESAQGVIGEWLFRGDGAPGLKSELLWSESVQPADARIRAVVLLRAEAGLPSEALALPYPTKSTTCDPAGAAPVSKVVLL